MTETSDKPTDCTLVLFTKRPRPGVGKQRVAEATGRQFALELAERLLDCAVEDLAAWPGPRVVCIADPADRPWAEAQVAGARVIVQRDGNLGERLAHATQRLSSDAAALLFIGSDAPTLTVPYLLRVADALGDHDVALGDATDGGVVAMACRRGWPDLAGLPWSTAALGAALARTCVAAGYSVARLPAHTDVDDADALTEIVGALQHDRRPARQALHRWLRRHRYVTGADDRAGRQTELST